MLLQRCFAFLVLFHCSKDAAKTASPRQLDLLKHFCDVILYMWVQYGFLNYPEYPIFDILMCALHTCALYRVSFLHINSVSCAFSTHELFIMCCLHTWAMYHVPSLHMNSESCAFSTHLQYIMCYLHTWEVYHMCYLHPSCVSCDFSTHE